MNSRTPRDIIVMGASTGGVDAFKTVIPALPRDLPAAVFVVLHRPDFHPSHLAEILRGASSLRVDDGLHGEPIEHGRVYVAPADNHLLVRDGHIDVVRGARVNGHRPAVNALFRSAASAYGPRVIGVVLTGALDCGTFGLMAVKAQGGVGIAEDPMTAACKDMPLSAIHAGAVDHVVPLDAVAPLLTQLTNERSSGPMVSSPSADKPPRYSFVTCPHCHGSMTEAGHAELTEFACHVGHSFSLRTLYAEQADQVETALWEAARALEESAALAHRMAEAATGSLKSRFIERERSMEHHAQIVRQIVLGGSTSARTDLPSEEPP